MTELCDLQIRVNDEETFFVNESIVSRFSGRLRKGIKPEKRQTRATHLDLHDFPGGPDAFERVLRFCYSQGQGQSMFTITVSNVAVLHCSAVFLGMTEKVMPCNLLHQTEAFLESMFYWSWSDTLSCLRSCGSFMTFADSIGLLQKLLCSLLAKIAQNSDVNLVASSSSPSSSSSSSAKTTPELNKPCSSTKSWWFDDLATLPPKIIEKFIKTLGAYGAENSSLVLTKFLLHYLNTTAVQSKGMAAKSRWEYGGLADTAVYGVVLMGKSSFSCRGMFWVLRIVSCFGLSRECRAGVERVIGGMLDQATLDDLLVCGHDGGAYDVNLVVRLVRVMVDGEGVGEEKMKRVGRLIDKYLCEISPDQNLKMSKFLDVAESLPDSARDCFDGVYRAIDIYLQSHPNLSWEGRSKLCGCLNYEKLSLEACKDLAKNPRIPPRIAVHALAAKAQQSNTTATKTQFAKNSAIRISTNPRSNKPLALYSEADGEGCEQMRLNLQRMQCRVLELEKVCKEMKGQMSRMVKGRPPHPRLVPRLC